MRRSVCLKKELINQPSVRERESKETHHLTQLDGRLAYFIPNTNRDLKKKCPVSEVWNKSGEVNNETKKKKNYCLHGSTLV